METWHVLAYLQMSAGAAVMKDRATPIQPPTTSFLYTDFYLYLYQSQLWYIYSQPLPTN